MIHCNGSRPHPSPPPSMADRGRVRVRVSEQLSLILTFSHQGRGHFGNTLSANLTMISAQVMIELQEQL